MSEENTTKPEGASNAGGATAEAYINEQLVKARKSLNSTRIAMSVVAGVELLSETEPNAETSPRSGTRGSEWRLPSDAILRITSPIQSVIQP